MWVGERAQEAPSAFGPPSVANQALLVLYRFLLERMRDTRAVRQFFTGKSSDRLEVLTDILDVGGMNSVTVADFIRSKVPDLVVVSGASAPGIGHP
jgi:hypothetical protein